LGLCGGCASAVRGRTLHGWAIGRHPGFANVGIAATAQVRDIVLLTRNTKHFEPFDIAVIDPELSLPDQDRRF
jgi:predicted nucleic acid-binding protein